jgi:hypothetical protein
MGKLFGKALERFRYIAIVFCATCGLLIECSLVMGRGVTYDQIEPVTLLKNASEHVGKFVKFQAKFSHITPKTKELLRSITGAKVDLDAYDSFKVHGEGFVFTRMLISRKKGSILCDLKTNTPVSIYGKIFRINMVGEPIILVHKIEKTANFP